ncbi:MAG: hypothetical protein VKI81_11985 [Synechococcaceae cyanobacterium]|nr:hypothetical protein [Synechococcaceae cyanobacterium]
MRRLPRPPLPITGAVLLLLLLLPAAGLLRWPRPRAEGLERLMGAASLLQSFPATPDRPVPQFWEQRLGRQTAQRAWRLQRRPWWQFWGPHADGAPYLALSAAAFPGGTAARLPAHSLRVGDLVVVAPDPLSLQLLADRLRPRMRAGRGLQRRCLQRLESEQAVFWNASALGAIVGPVAPLLQRFQEGCLALAIESGGLRWSGEAAAVDGVLTPLQPGSAVGAEPVPPRPPLPADRLLELEGSSLEPLVQGLLARQLIREPLASRYGLDERRLPLLRRAPFRLRLLPRSSGPFQASLELQLAVGDKRREWEEVLRRLAKALQEQGLSAEPPRSPSPTPEGSPENSAPEGGSPDPRPPRAPGDPARAATWHRKDGVVVGGWRWLAPAGSPPQLLLHLGPAPTGSPAPAPVAAPVAGSPPLRLRVRPQALNELGLLPPQMPPLVGRSEQLWLEAEPLEGATASEPVSRLKGRLQVPR